LNLTTGTTVSSGSVLFAVQDVKAETKPETTQDAKTSQANATAKAKMKPGDKQGEKEGKKEKAPAAAPAEDPNQPLFSKLEVRVGKVMKAWHHPEADRLFCEEIDVGEPTGFRQIVTGLREHYKLDEFEGKRLLVICNMKPAKLKNVMSSGIVLCAKNAETKVMELLGVPDECKIGDRVLPQGMPDSWAAADPAVVKKQGIWEDISKDLLTDASRIACYAGKPLVTAAGSKFVAPTLPEAVIG